MKQYKDDVVLRVRDKLTGDWWDYDQSRYTFFVWKKFGENEYPTREVTLEQLPSGQRTDDPNAGGAP